MGHWSLVVVTHPPIHERQTSCARTGRLSTVLEESCVVVVGKLGRLLGPTVSLPQGVHVEGWKPPDMVRHPQSGGLWASREGGRGLQLILLMHVVLIPKRLLIEE